MASAWPGRAGDPFADRMNAIEKYVVSSTLSEADLTWENSHLIAFDEIRSLRERAGGDLVVWGSTQLVPALLAEGLVDELNLMVEPILLGGGKRIFPADGAARPLELVEAKTASTGVLVCTYRPVR
jgi:dihydrofolate reductase